MRENAAPLIPTFQYPRSDRRRCNYDFFGEVRFYEENFQYPRSDRRRCNAGCWSALLTIPSLSVSSVGSEAMQLECLLLGRAEGILLSVSSVGSEAMQH